MWSTIHFSGKSRQPPLSDICFVIALTLSGSNRWMILRYPTAFSLVPKTADNAPFCDSAGRGFSAALAANTCANIRGNLGRNTIIGPGLFNVDFSVFKNNRIPKISESANLQFRAEFFNILNRTNFAPASNLSRSMRMGPRIRYSGNSLRRKLITV